MSELGYPPTGATPLWLDNQSAIRVGKNPEHHSRMCHPSAKPVIAPEGSYVPEAPEALEQLAFLWSAPEALEQLTFLRSPLEG